MKKNVAILCGILVLLCSCGKSADSKQKVSVKPEISISKGCVPFEEFSLKEGWKETLDKVPDGFGRSYTQANGYCRRFSFGGVVFTDEQENSVSVVTTRYYIYLDKGIFLAERFMYNKRSCKQSLVKFNEVAAFGEIIAFLDVTEKGYYFKR